MTDRQIPTVRPSPPEPQRQEDGVRWLVGVLVELSRRFIGHAIKRYPEHGSEKHRCPICGGRN